MIQKKRQFVTTQEAAEYIGMKPATLEVWRVYGKGPVFRKFGRVVRYEVKDLDKWIDDQARTHTGQANQGQL